MTFKRYYRTEHLDVTTFRVCCVPSPSGLLELAGTKNISSTPDTRTWARHRTRSANAVGRRTALCNSCRNFWDTDTVRQPSRIRVWTSTLQSNASRLYGNQLTKSISSIQQ